MKPGYDFSSDQGFVFNLRAKKAIRFLLMAFFFSSGMRELREVAYWVGLRDLRVNNFHKPQIMSAGGAMMGTSTTKNQIRKSIMP